MKKTTLLSGVRQNFTQIKGLFFGTFLLVSATAQSQTYCTPATGNCSEGDQIANVTFAGINNDSACGTQGYNDFTAGTAATIIAGQSYPISVTVPVHIGTQHVAVWIDYNDDGTFDASEFTTIGTSPAAGSVVTGTVAVPVTATGGNTRMRVKAQYAQAIAGTSSCAAPYLGYGEYEDYSVNITAATACTGTPAVGAATSTQASVCPQTSFVLNATGVTPSAGYSYQWQSSPTGTDQWANIGTAQTSLNYSATGQTQATFYRVIITCSGSGLSATSTAISVAQNAVDACYCTNAINFNCGDGDVITNVTIGTMTNATACGNSTTGYTNYSGSVTPPVFNIGSAIPVSVSVGPSGEGWLYESVGVWIDYNRNGVFEEAEYNYIGTGLNEALAGSITIPATAVVGNTRMRVVVAASAATSFGHQFACGPVVADNNFGEMEDYTVTIAPSLSTPGFENASVSVYPNPTNGLVNIQFANQTAVDAINVYSVSGQLVYSKQFNNVSDNYTIDLQKAATGVYIMKLEGENGTIVKRLIKN